MTAKVGQLLKKTRESKYLTYEDVSAQTKIHPKFLKALEAGDYEIFSSEIHAKGFLQTYANFLGVNFERILPFFRRDFIGRKQKVTPAVMPIVNTKLFLTPMRLLTGLIVTFVILFFGYLFFQYRSFAGSPLLIVSEPAQEELVIQTPSVVIAGRTDPDATVFINGQKIGLHEAGNFSTSISLSNGLNELIIVAENKLGKATSVTRKISVQRDEETVTIPSIVPSSTGNLEVEVIVSPNAAQLEVYVDGSKVFEGLVGTGVSKVFVGTAEVKVTTGNSGSTSVKVNGKDQGNLGQEGETSEKTFKAPPPPVLEANPNLNVGDSGDVAGDKTE